jgi:pyruvate/2-oxoglutarate dehydrogenase complex dihydrolipoamide dehydrogenase (E3) component
VADRYDLIVLGAGVGGAEVASQAAGKGFDVLTIEQRVVGGECPYWGCIPSKAMTRATRALGEAVRAGQLAGKSAVEPDWTVLASQVAEVSEHWDDTRAAARLERRGATLLRGRGRILGPGGPGRRPPAHRQEGPGHCERHAADDLAG